MEDQRATIAATDAPVNAPGAPTPAGGFDVDMTDDERIMQAILAQSLAESTATVCAAIVVVKDDCGNGWEVCVWFLLCFQAPAPAPAAAPVAPEVPVTPAPTPAVAPGSTEGTAGTATPAPTASSAEDSASFTDPAFINELLASLGEGIDLNDPLIRVGFSWTVACWKGCYDACLVWTQ
jgi:hypothetical protein